MSEDWRTIQDLLCIVQSLLIALDSSTKMSGRERIEYIYKEESFCNQWYQKYHESDL